LLLQNLGGREEREQDRLAIPFPFLDVLPR